MNEQTEQSETEGMGAASELSAGLGAWMPIETAPKDGTRILVGGKSPNGNRGYDAVGQAYWRREIKYAEDSPRCDEPEGFYWASDNTRSGQCAWYVTHWMPLPEAPNAKVTGSPALSASPRGLPG